MSDTSTPDAPSALRSRRLRIVIAIIVALAVAIPAGTWLYIRSQGDAPERLSVDDVTATTAAGTPAPAADTGAPDGTWQATTGSTAGYRVKEVLFGQSTEAVGRTSDVTGSVTIEGTRVTETTFTVDMTTVSSDESRRDNQFKGRIMAVDQFPTSTFTLTEPIELGSVPGVGTKINIVAVGDLTLKGTTKSVTFPLEAERTATGINVAGSLPIVFEEWGISNPSFGPAQTEDRGELEVLLVLAR